MIVGEIFPMVVQEIGFAQNVASIIFPAIQIVFVAKLLNIRGFLIKKNTTELIFHSSILIKILLKMYALFDHKC